MARPREFDHQKVLTQIINLFWEKGFEGTSMDDLVEATGLNRGSLYTCFGNKEKIFAMALEEYVRQGPFKWCRKKTAIDSLCCFYEFIISTADHPGKQRRGCLVFNSCLEFGNKSNRLSTLVIALGKKTEGFFQELIEEAQLNGEIPHDLCIKKAAQRTYAASFTIQEMAKFKPDKEFLSEIANGALASLGTERRVASS